MDNVPRRVYIDRTTEQIKESPEFDKDTYGGPDYRDRVADYHGRTYG